MKKINKYTRRKFVKQSVFAGAFLPVASNFSNAPLMKPFKRDDQLEISVFSKHLQFLNYRDMAAAAADMGFDGVELTVRKGGHVEPRTVKEDLPKGVAAIKEVGLQSDMMVSDITELSIESRAVLETAANLGIKYYRLGYYRYPDKGSMPDALKQFNLQMKELAVINKDLGILGCYQNHSGTGVGASMWEVWQLLEGIAAESMGSQYDVRHAMVDGGNSWRNGFRLIKDRIKTLAIKDFRWEKINGKWSVIDTPLGEGTVDFVSYFRLLKENDIKAPFVIHYEYDLFGAEHGSREIDKANQKKVYAAMSKDLN
ncbi:MAG: TIM barrel protein, partial [Bacteroidetes bacterium]|nr:TIM barrel protein [Bacteroidota bacterium]